jgi:hypothetical protein
MTNEPRLVSPAQFELDRDRAQSEFLGKTGISGFPNRMVQVLFFSQNSFFQFKISRKLCKFLKYIENGIKLGKV